MVQHSKDIFGFSILGYTWTWYFLEMEVGVMGASFENASKALGSLHRFLWKIEESAGLPVGLTS